MNSSLPNGSHMSMDTFKNTISLCVKWKVRAILISGGDPFTHPQLSTMLDYVKTKYEKARLPVIVALLTNGWWHSDNAELEKAKRIIAKPIVRMVQVSTLKEFYPNYEKTIEFFTNNRIDKVELQDNWLAQTRFQHVGRGKLHTEIKNEGHNKCIDIYQRVVLRYCNTMSELISQRESVGKFCSPSVTFKGDVVLGETRFCKPIGNVNRTCNYIDNIRRFNVFECDRCGKLGNCDNSIINRLKSLLWEA